MAWQKGPGEGFHAAKDDALTINPQLRCRAIRRASYPGGQAKFFGYIVEDKTGRVIGRDVKQARDAWADAFFKLGGRYEGGKAIFSSRVSRRR